MTPTLGDRIFASTFAGLLAAPLAVVEWESVYPRWLRWPLAVLGVAGIAGVVWWMGRPDTEG